MPFIINVLLTRGNSMDGVGSNNIGEEEFYLIQAWGS